MIRPAEVEAAANILLANIHAVGRSLLTQIAQSAIDRLDEIDGDTDLECGGDIEPNGDETDWSAPGDHGEYRARIPVYLAHKWSPTP
ncbi:hypothetical protein [Sphingopyxis sp.]|uniref:hypothetical protein n=1 Tax=Sphingopyxis sp. TaxID=1908224 RepID=UPI001D5FDA47|nr:hypothetical protein [Sphingopyxis sp.]MBW8296185.1 hypothetical protein [Sphingopyxis sp.]